MGWMNDATVRFEETPFNFETGAMFRKIVRDIRAGQREDGAISCTVPYAVFGSFPADPVCSSYLVAAWQNYLHNGDLETIRENFEGFAAWENCLLNHSDDYIVNYSYYGDWAGPAYACEGNDGAKSVVTPGIFMSTGYSYYNCTLLSKFARLLNMEERAQEYDALAGKIRQAILDKWYDASSAKMATGSEACQAFALWLGIIPESDCFRAAKLMRDDLVARDYRFTTGNLCTRYMLDMLSAYGYEDDAYALMTREEYPSFGFMIQQEATTVWERFELKKQPGMNSHNHPMYGAADSWLYTALLGIKPTGAGFETLTIAPKIPAKLMSAQGNLDTVKGRINVKWVKRYGGVHLYIDLPAGVTATVLFGREEKTLTGGTHHLSMALDECR
jgi:alpha-L-rhamnosidase